MSKSEGKWRILLVDDHEIVRLGLMTLINDQVDMEVAAETGSASEAIAFVERYPPDVVLMDIRLPGCSGIRATEEIVQRFPETKVVMLTSFADEELLLDAIRVGAAGYVLKQVGNQEVLRAVRAACREESLLDTLTTARLLRRVRQDQRRAEKDAFQFLTGRELDVLRELAQGYSNATIGKRLNLKEKTVRNYVSNILEKLGMSNRIELATYAVQHRIGDQEPR